MCVCVCVAADEPRTTQVEEVTPTTCVRLVGFGFSLATFRSLLLFFFLVVVVVVSRRLLYFSSAQTESRARPARSGCTIVGSRRGERSKSRLGRVCVVNETEKQTKRRRRLKLIRTHSNSQLETKKRKFTNSHDDDELRPPEKWQSCGRGNSAELVGSLAWLSVAPISERE